MKNEVKQAENIFEEERMKNETRKGLIKGINIGEEEEKKEKLCEKIYFFCEGAVGFQA
jgi:hypothetical protein